MSEIDIKLGIYRHWKGKLYRVLKLASDANEDDLAYRNPNPGEHGPVLEGENEWFAFGERQVVVYEPIQPGPLPSDEWCVRTVEDFVATIHTEDGSVCLGPRCGRVVGLKFADRFTYLGPELTSRMLENI